MSPIRPPLEDDAADWLARRVDGLTPAEEVEFTAWKAADPARAEAFERLQRTWLALNHPRETGRAEMALQELGRRQRRRTRRRVWSATAVAGVIVLLATFGPAGLRRPKMAMDRPAGALGFHPDIRHLADGSDVELNAGADIDLDFGGARRDIRLLRGEATFTVAKDPARPFFVTAAGVRVQALGTTFNVLLGADRVEVLVTEGRVAVNTPGPAEKALEAEAGQRVTVALRGGAAEPRIRAADAAECARSLAWHSQRFEFTRAPLGQVLPIFNRQNRLQLVIGDPSLSALEITGIYWAGDPDGFVRLLNSGLDLRAQRRGDVVILRGP